MWHVDKNLSRSKRGCSRLSYINTNSKALIGETTEYRVSRFFFSFSSVFFFYLQALINISITWKFYKVLPEGYFSAACIKSNFLRKWRIGRQSRKIDLSLISPKHTFKWTYSSLKLPRVMLRAKLTKDRNLYVQYGGFRGLECSKFHVSLRKQRGRKNHPMKMKLCTNIISFLNLKIVQLVS